MSIKLFCLVKGNSATHAFPVNINMGDTIGDLKKAIKAEKKQAFGSVDADDLKLWRVEIPINRDNTVQEPTLDNELFAVNDIGDYWTVTPPKKYIHVIVEQPIVTVPPSKRRKIEINSETLRKLWNALKNGQVNEIGGGQFLLFFDDVSYLTGQNEQGLKMSTLFIRECYLHLSKIIFEDVNVRRWRITGNPGIGKTFFGYYLLYLLAQQNKTVVYHRHNKPPILFSKEKAFSISIDNVHEFGDYLENYDVWYIVDGRSPTEFVAKTILICSPQKRYYGTFDKIGTTIRYMPVWSWEETDMCRNSLFRDLTQKKVKELYNKWGGIPRFTLFYALNISQQELLQKAINSVNDKILNFIGETTEDNSASHKIVHIHTNLPQVGEKGKGVEEVEEISEVEESSSPAVTKPDKDNEGVPFYTLSNLDFASDYVYEKVMDVLMSNYREQLQAFVQASKSISDYGTLRGTIFKRIAHESY